VCEAILDSRPAPYRTHRKKHPDCENNIIHNPHLNVRRKVSNLYIKNWKHQYGYLQAL
jgi:hypothetical protein